MKASSKLPWKSCGIAIVLAAGGALCGASGSSSQDSPELMRIGPASAPLRASPSDEGAPALADLLQGAAVRVIGRRDGFARIVVEGWVLEQSLAALEVGTPAGEPAAPPAPQPPPEPPKPVHDLGLTHHVGVVATLREKDGVRELAITLELRTAQERPVVVEGSKQSGRVRVYEQLRIAGGRARGAELVARAVSFEAGRATLALPLADLGAKTPGVVLVSASAELSPTRVVHGAATDVALVAR